MSEPYPDLWKRAARFMRAKHPEIVGVPSKEMFIDLLLKEVGF